MDILVTGGAGFIGSSMVRLLLKRGYGIRVLDKLTYAAGGSWENLNGFDVECIEGDICLIDDCQAAVEGVSAVIHFAAESHVTRSETAEKLFRKVNVEGTRNLLEAAYNEGIERFLHVSTDEVYGSIIEGFFREEDKIFGDSQATSPYAKSKALADDLAVSWIGRIPYLAAARPTNNFGPRQHPEKALPRWITRLLRGEKIPVWGEGKQVRDWLYVEDCCEAILVLLEESASGVYNIAANNQPEIMNRQMAEILIEVFGLAEDRIDFVRDPRPQHDFRYGVNTDKIFQEFGWQPGWSIVSAVEETVAWYRENESWWQRRIKEAEALYFGKE